MNVNLQLEESAPSVTIQMLIARYGVWRILGAVAAALMRRESRAARRMSREMSAHLRRDIGLPPVPPSPRHWDVRL